MECPETTACDPVPTKRGSSKVKQAPRRQQVKQPRKHKNAKEAAEGAAEAALAAYLMEAGRGHELALARGSKLEIELQRALYLVKE